MYGVKSIIEKNNNKQAGNLNVSMLFNRFFIPRVSQFVRLHTRIF
jgi:hypothetical protein